jgi:hypothetical protein
MLRKGIRTLGLDPDSDNVNIRLSDEGTNFGVEDYPTMGINTDLLFEDNEIKLVDLFEKIRKETKSEWWFEKDGTFNFGALPPQQQHNLRFITDTTAGLNTPPYRSVKVIGSGIASSDGKSAAQLRSDEKIIRKREIRKPTQEEIEENEIYGSDTNKIKPRPPEDYNNLLEPVFTYKNLELTTIDQVENAADSIANDLAEQTKKGKITTTGFPEVTPLDTVRMPQAEDESKLNYSERQPMGGAEYNVRKVVHKLNDSDGFKTVIHVSGLTDKSRTDFEEVEEPDDDSQPDANDNNESGDIWDAIAQSFI